MEQFYYALNIQGKNCFCAKIFPLIWMETVDSNGNLRFLENKNIAIFPKNRRKINNKKRYFTSTNFKSSRKQCAFIAKLSQAQTEFQCG